MINVTNPIIKIGIHNGENTHNQLQVATTPHPPNLSVRNIRKIIVPIPNPEPFDSSL